LRYSLFALTLKSWLESVDLGGMNSLYYGDNLTILREHIKDESVDLVYLDPPFNSQTTYNVLGAFGDSDVPQVTPL